MEQKRDTSVHALIARCITGSPDEADQKAIELWLSHSDENRKFYQNLLNIWESSTYLDISTGEALAKVMARIEERERKHSLGFYLQKFAAVLFIPLLVAIIWLIFNNQAANKQTVSETWHETSASFGTISSIVLPDGSKVWLNAGSKIRYPETFRKNHRDVELKGEAFFEVHSDKKHPFTVNTGNLQITATGTKFNVMSYPGHQPEVALVEGTVNVSSHTSPNHASASRELLSNQLLTYDTNTNNFQVSGEDLYKYIAWKDGKLVFRNDSFTEVARKLSIQYNVDIELADQRVKQYSFRASFENEPIEELLTLLKLSSPFSYREISPKAMPDGTFTRKKFIISSVHH